MYYCQLQWFLHVILLLWGELFAFLSCLFALFVLNGCFFRSILMTCHLEIVHATSIYYHSHFNKHFNYSRIKWTRPLHINKHAIHPYKNCAFVLWRICCLFSPPKHVNLLKMYSPSGNLRCRWVCFFIRTDLEKCCSTSLALQWILCSEWVPNCWLKHHNNPQVIHISSPSINILWHERLCL